MLMTKHGLSLEYRFFLHVDKTDYCWNWVSTTDGKGYGLFNINGKMNRVHRVSYEIHKGKITKGLVIDHLCRNRLCVNPEHLEMVTNKENILRGEGLCAIEARKTHCPKNHPYSGDNLYIDKKGSRSYITCRTIRRRLNGGN